MSMYGGELGREWGGRIEWGENEFPRESLEISASLFHVDQY